jgi:chemotaxis protein methyltransferase CheR
MRTPIAERQACQLISQLVCDRYGIQMRDGKEALIQARLGKRIRHLGLAGVAAYCDWLRQRDDPEEWTLVVDALTTNCTQFLREADHFSWMVEQAVPSAPKQNGRPFRVWSAACSSGEEACSIGMYLAEHGPAVPGWDWEVTASDISTKVLGRAKLGIYAGDSLNELPRPWLQKYFQKGLGQWEGYYRVKRIIADRIHFQQINLMADYSHPHNFQIIFLRNVMIYFDHASREQIVNRLCRFLAPQGYVLTGHSESLNGLNVPLRYLRPSIYQSTLP